MFEYQPLIAPSRTPIFLLAMARPGDGADAVALPGGYLGTKRRSHDHSYGLKLKPDT